MLEIKGDMTCEEKLRFWREAAAFWRKGIERMEKDEDEAAIRRLMQFKCTNYKNPLSCEEKLRFWKEAAKFWRKEYEIMEKKGGETKNGSNNNNCR